MKTQTLFAVILATLLTPYLSWSQESTPLQPIQTQPSYQQPNTAIVKSPIPDSETVTKIFELKHFPAGDLETLIVNIFGIKSGQIQSPRLDLLIVQATKKQMQDIEALIQELDVEQTESETSQKTESFIYRIYMFETAPENPGLKPFSMILQTHPQLSSSILEVAAAVNIQVSDFLITDERGDEIDILIQGKALSDESIREMINSITDSRIKELKWDDGETFTNNIDAAHYSHLPVQLQDHIENFLGNNIVTTGYWFGNSSVPGRIEAPIGPWIFRLELEQETGRTIELRVEVLVPDERHSFERQLGREQSNTILSNTIQVKAGKPIIIGYNRQSYGTRRMGAMVIIPEADMTGSKDI